MESTRVTIREVRTVGPDTVALELETPEGFDALPGQFVLLRADVGGDAEDGTNGGGDGDAGEVARHYTLSSPGVDETFEITVGIDPEGDLSPWLADREPGDVVEVEGPFGEVTYDPGMDGDVVVVAGGPGVGPAVGVGEAAAVAGNDVAVVYEDDRPAHEDRLAALSVAGADVTVVTDGHPDAAGGDPGTDDRLEAAVRRAAADARTDEVYVFGFRSFLDRALPALEAAGVDPGAANVENFG